MCVRHRSGCTFLGRFAFHWCHTEWIVTAVMITINNTLRRDTRLGRMMMFCRSLWTRSMMFLGSVVLMMGGFRFHGSHSKRVIAFQGGSAVGRGVRRGRWMGNGFREWVPGRNKLVEWVFWLLLLLLLLVVMMWCFHWLRPFWISVTAFSQYLISDWLSTLVMFIFLCGTSFRFVARVVKCVLLLLVGPLLFPGNHRRRHLERCRVEYILFEGRCCRWKWWRMGVVTLSGRKRLTDSECSVIKTSEKIK